MSDSHIQATRQSAIAEAERCSAITACCARYGYPQIYVEGQPVALATHAISTGLSARETELEAKLIHLEARGGNSMAMPASPLGGSNGTSQGEVYQAALMLRAGLDDAAKHEFSEQTLKAASGIADMSMLRMGEEMLKASGQPVPSGKSALAEVVLKANGFTTLSLAETLGAACGRAAAFRFTEYPATWRTIGKIERVNDFREQSRVAMSTIDGLEQLPPDGQIKHVQLMENFYQVHHELLGQNGDAKP